VTLADRMDQHFIPGISIAVIHHDRVEWSKGYGVQDTEMQEPVTSETMFQAASISKPVTAAAVLRLVEQGRLDLDEDVETYLVSWRLPKSDSWQPSITLRQLLCHGAGLTAHGFPGYTRDAVLPTLLFGKAPTNGSHSCAPR
jgi:CubicO group peptidase (beta-lactamase class C family)